jgi:hypothetical protein
VKVQVGAALALVAWLISAGTSQAVGEVTVPVPTYPVAKPLPLGDNRLPLFMDDDEVVLGSLASDGHLVGLKSDMRIKVSGSGDYVVRLPGPVESVADLGGDSVPGLSAGHVSFLGRLSGGVKVIAAEAQLDLTKYPDVLPLSVKIAYAGPSAGTSRGTFTETIDLENLTGEPHQFQAGVPDSAPLAQVLEALRGVPGIFTPETDLATIYPVPTSLRLRPPITSVDRQVFVPLAIEAIVKLPPGYELLDAPDAGIVRDSRGAQLRWFLRMPTDFESGGSRRLSLSFTGAPPLRTPSVEVKVTVVPMPGTLFEPPTEGSWALAVKSQPASEMSSLSVLAQAGMASLHRIEDLSPPVGRPGPGPERVSYDLVLESAQPEKPRPKPEPPLRTEAWAVGLLCLGAVAVGANAWWAWSRH